MFFKSRQADKVERLRTLPRFQKGTFSFNEYNIEYSDPLSFYWEYMDIFKRRIYHFESSESKPHIIDAGGCVGMSALYFKHAYPESTILSFEPDPEIFKILKRNIEGNRLQGITPINAALGKKEGLLSFFPDGADGGSLLGSESPGKTDVQVVPLSRFMNNPIDMLKMNIEGMEGDVFEEIQDKLEMVKEIIFEYHAFDALPQTLGRILEILDAHGFRYLINDATNSEIPVPFHLPRGYRCFNLVYAKNRSFFPADSKKT